MEGIGEILCESCELLQKSRKISQNAKKGGRKRCRNQPERKKLIKLENEEKYMK